MIRKTKKLEDEIIDLKSVNGKYTNNNEKSNSCKNYSNYFSNELK